jgi:hypothetical protein
MSNWLDHFPGQVIHPYIVVCWSCGKAKLGFRQKSEFSFKKQLVDIGWRPVEGLWVCPEHKDEDFEILMPKED